MARGVRDLTVEAIQFYEDNPVDFCIDIIGATPDPWQEDALNALRDYHFVAIKSGSGVGKSWILSAATMWFLSTKPNCKVPTTAPSQHQLYDVLWSEHFNNISKSEILQKMLSWTQTRIAMKGREPSWYAVARTAQVSPSGDIAEGLQGFHAEDNLLFIADEASGIPDAIFPAMEGALTGPNAYAILAGNPTRKSGYFYDVFNDPAMANLYHKMTVSCYDSPRVEKRYLDMMEARYGKDHPVFMVKVLGEFPESDFNLLIPPAYMEVFKYNTLDKASKREDVEFGIDVGRTSSRSVICIRRGLNVLEFADRFRTGGVTDTIDITNWAIEYIQSYSPVSVKVDCIGIGAGVYDNLKSLYPRIVKPVVGNLAPSEAMKTRYLNLRAEGYWNLRNTITKMHCDKIPDMLELELNDLRYKITNTGKIQIESKEDIAKRTNRSPDYSDALMYSLLDSSLCVIDRKPQSTLNFGIINTELTKENIWSFEPEKESRWRNYGRYIH